MEIDALRIVDGNKNTTAVTSASKSGGPIEYF